MNPTKLLLVLSSISLIVACTPNGGQAIDPSPSGPIQDLLSVAVVSDTGVTLEVPEVRYGDECIRVNIAASGNQFPEGMAPDQGPPIPVGEATFFQDDRELSVQPLGGGGGGGGGPDGQFNLEQEMVYTLNSPLSTEQSVELTVELLMDPLFGFDSPLRFLVLAEPDDSPNCGLQGSSDLE